MGNLKKIEISYELKPLAELEETARLLIEKTKSARFSAYSPYSKFQVGAAALLGDGTIVSGANQENRAFPSGLCAERVCLFAAGANYPNEKIMKLAVVAFHRGSEEAEPANPCGGCRQVMLEAEMRQEQPFEVLLLYPDEQVLILQKAVDLLPFPFETKL